MRVIITADTHIHDWKVPSTEIRTRQYLDLANWLNELAEETGAKRIFIAGDVFHTPTPSPRALKTAQRFFEILEEGPASVEVTHGQHDLYVRSGGELLGNSVLTPLKDMGLPIRYYHRETNDLGVYFYGWEPNYSLPEEAGRARLIITHATVVGSKLEAGWIVKDGHAIPEEGPPVIAGDIHRHQVIGRVIIPGPPIQHTRGDSPDTGVIVFDLDMRTWEFVRTGTLGNEPVYSFLTFKRETKKEERKPIEVETRKFDPIEVVSELSKKAGVAHVSERILPKVKRNGDSPLDLRFTFRTLVLENFRSHERYVLDFSEYPDVNLIVGPNGAGKSSIFEAIRFAIHGGPATSLKRIGAKTMQVSLEVETSSGDVLKIIRGHDKKGYFHVYVNGEEVEAPTINAKEMILKSLAPSLLDIDLWYWDQSALGPLSSRPQKDRFALVARALNLGIIEGLYQEAKATRDTLVMRLRSLEERIRTLKELDTPREDELQNARSRLDEVTSRLAQVEEAIALARKRVSETDTTSLERELSLLKREKDTLLKTIEEDARHLKALALKTCPVCGAPLKDEKHQTMLEASKQRLKQSQARLRELGRMIQETEKELQRRINLQSPEEAKRLRRLEDQREELSRERARLLAEIEQVERLKRVHRKLEKSLEAQARLKEEVSDYDRFLEIVSPKGLAMASILTSAGDLLSNHVVRVSAVKTLKSGEVRPHFNLEMKIGDHWVGFDYLSGGQKTLAEVAFFSRLSSIIGGTGELLMDESLRYLDEDHVMKAMDYLREGGVHRIWLISHHEVVPNIGSVIRVG